MAKDLRIIFMGTPNFAVGVLKGMIEAGLTIVGVVTAPDRPAGRGKKLTASAVKEYALSQNLKVLQPTNLKDPSFLKELERLKANLQVVVAFRMLPQAVWEMPKYGTFNLHASLLPQYRGAAPINWAIINQEKKTGVTTFFIDEKIDTGSIISNKEISIQQNETAESLHDKLMELGSELVLETIELIKKDQANPKPQTNIPDLKGAPKLTNENTRIDWSKSGAQIEAFIRGLAPYPTAWTLLQNNGEHLKMKIYASSFEKSSHSYEPGTLYISKKVLKVACVDGFVHLIELQLPGKRRMEVSSLLNGYSFAPDSKVS